MQSDRELLELAAKAAEIEYGWQYIFEDYEGCTADKWDWNPLTDDGHAMRLMVKTGMQIWRNTDSTVSAMPPGEVIGFWSRLRDPLEPDPYAATRRAIVRAAAAIGEAMP